MESVCNEGRQKIAVIGAGMAGMCALRHFALDPKYSVVAFERMATFAGVWNYPDQAEKYTDEPNTSPNYCRTYRDLRTISPRDLTGFPDFPFPQGKDSYCKREVVLRYLHDYVEHFGLSAFIKLRHQVNLIKPAARNSSGQVIKWNVEVLNLDEQCVTVEDFDNVLICNGHNHTPNKPTLPGLHNFKGTILHSSRYRIPEVFEGKNVLIVGARASSNDITCALIPYAKQVIVCRRSETFLFTGRFPNVTESTGPAGFGVDHVVLPDGSKLDVDIVLLCTGFLYDFPFLSDDCQVNTTGFRVSPLYRHIIHCKNPSMAFIGLVKFTVVGRLINAQVVYYKTYLDGKIQLPSTTEMLAEEEDERLERNANGIPDDKTHDMRVLQWAYMDMLGKNTGVAPCEPVLQVMWNATGQGMRSVPCAFRNFRVEKIDLDNCIHVLLPENEQLYGLKPVVKEQV